MKAEAVEVLKKDLIVIGGSAGKVAGEKAGTEAGSKINIPMILTEAIAAAVEAAKTKINEKEAGVGPFFRK